MIDPVGCVLWLRLFADGQSVQSRYRVVVCSRIDVGAVFTHNRLTTRYCPWETLQTEIVLICVYSPVLL